MLEGLDQVPWPSFPQPAENRPQAVPEALRALVGVKDQRAADAVYDRLLHALGNNHSGTYYPVAVAAIPFLAEVLAKGERLPRQATLDVLIDLVGSFSPEPGFEVMPSPNPRSVAGALRDAVNEVRPMLVALLSSPEAGQREQMLGQQLLDLLAEDPPRG
jgi:hypothetical protein